MKNVNISMIDVAYKILLDQKELKFDVLLDKVSEVFEFNENEKKDRKSDFYNQLTIDGRFVFINDFWRLS